jgi:hypothetical protein
MIKQSFNDFDFVPLCTVLSCLIAFVYQSRLCLLCCKKNYKYLHFTETKNGRSVFDYDKLVQAKVYYNFLPIRFDQGSLTEGEGSVRLTSLYWCHDTQHRGLLSDIQRNNQLHNAECRFLCIVMLSVVMLRIVVPLY